jgi:hypothetical protein
LRILGIAKMPIPHRQASARRKYDQAQELTDFEKLLHIRPPRTFHHPGHVVPVKYATSTRRLAESGGGVYRKKVKCRRKIVKDRA